MLIARDRYNIRDTAAPWFEKFADTEYAMQVLLGTDENMGELWGFGRNPSPVRHYFIGHLALQSSACNWQSNI